jgi:hypothetical protein
MHKSTRAMLEHWSDGVVGLLRDLSVPLKGTNRVKQDGARER